jgi:hypothetical protein
VARSPVRAGTLAVLDVDGGGSRCPRAESQATAARPESDSVRWPLARVGVDDPLARASDVGFVVVAGLLVALAATAGAGELRLVGVRFFVAVELGNGIVGSGLSTVG